MPEDDNDNISQRWRHRRHSSPGHNSRWLPLVKLRGYYNPIESGSIDGTDTVPHDKAVLRAVNVRNYTCKVPPNDVKSGTTLFIGRLPYRIQPEEVGRALRQLASSSTMPRSDDHRQQRSRHRERSPFTSSSQSVDWPSIRIVRHLITGQSRGYAFATFKSYHQADAVVRSFVRSRRERNTIIDAALGPNVIIERAFGSNDQLPGWRPRRLGGGLGGRKESGQLRFGGVDRPFRRPFAEGRRAN